jgi:inward rectifier potassium channel
MQKGKLSRKSKISHSRLIHRAGVRVKIVRRGIKRISRSDFYIKTMGAGWIKLILLVLALFVLVNSMFAFLYLLEDGSIEGARSGSFEDAFFFSIQTLATIGYGKLSPTTTFANILVSIEALIGLSGVAIFTGIIFSKISKPTARILFGDKAIISSYKDLSCLMIRLGNLRNSQIADPKIKVTLICDEISEERVRRSYHDLKLTKNTTPILLPSWTAKHIINEESPLFKVTKRTLKQKNIEIIISVAGFDEILSQTVHSHQSYIADEILFGGSFVDIISHDKNGRTNVDYTKFHQIKN